MIILPLTSNMAVAVVDATAFVAVQVYVPTLDGWALVTVTVEVRPVWEPVSVIAAFPAPVNVHVMFWTGNPMFAVQVNVGDALLCTSAFVGGLVIIGATERMDIMKVVLLTWRARIPVLNFPTLTR